MHRAAIWVVLLTLGCASAPTSSTSDTATAIPMEAAAQELVNAIAAGRYADATVRFTPEMRMNLGPSQLQGVWQQITREAGSLKRVGEPQRTVERGYDVVLIPLMFERSTLRARVVFDRGARVAGLFFVP